MAMLVYRRVISKRNQSGLAHPFLLSFLRLSKNHLDLAGSILRLFQHTPKPLPTGYKGISFIVDEQGIAWGLF